MKKINFSDKFGLTEAVLSGRKTQTRRIIKMDSLEFYAVSQSYGTTAWKAIEKSIMARHARYNVGEVVAVAQAYRDFGAYCIDSRAMTDKRYVKAEYMPHQIRITDVRVERLQDISDEDCIAEGVCKWTKDRELFKYDIADGFEMFEWRDMPRTPREAYAALIDRISGKGTWQSNPYVFVYEFELIK